MKSSSQGHPRPTIKRSSSVFSDDQEIRVLLVRFVHNRTCSCTSVCKCARSYTVVLLLLASMEHKAHYVKCTVSSVIGMPQFCMLVFVTIKMASTSCEPKHSSAYSEALQWRMVYQHEALDLSCKDVAANLCVDPSTVSRIVSMF